VRIPRQKRSGGEYCGRMTCSCYSGDVDGFTLRGKFGLLWANTGLPIYSDANGVHTKRSLQAGGLVAVWSRLRLRCYWGFLDIVALFERYFLPLLP
jgi:hypothetical protein